MRGKARPDPARRRTSRAARRSGSAGRERAGRRRAYSCQSPYVSSAAATAEEYDAHRRIPQCRETSVRQASVPIQTASAPAASAIPTPGRPPAPRTPRRARALSARTANRAPSARRRMPAINPLWVEPQSGRGYNRLRNQGRSSTGRAPVSKTGGCRFESCRPCIRGPQPGGPPPEPYASKAGIPSPLVSDRPQEGHPTAN